MFSWPEHNNVLHNYPFLQLFHFYRLTVDD
uniref:Uncharacterized protein n=1 Tax=Anguilla anguilla TaxID=7936 RepID=A0A0E9V5C9_ANGAN